MELRLLPAYLKAVFKHGWWVLLAVLGGIGDVATVVGDFPVPRWLWYSLIALGVLGAQFRTYCDVRAELAMVRGRLRELDTDEAKRAYLREQIARAERLQQRIGAVTDTAQWYGPLGRTYNMDIVHWENEVRAELRESFEGDLDLLFDSEDGFDFDRTAIRSPESEVAYLERRIIRLRQIEQGL